MSKLLKALLTHYSPQENLKEIDPAHAGSGVDTKRNISEHPISYYYQEGAVPESVVTDPARQKYTVKLPEGYPIYDIGTDPDRHIHNLIEQSKNRQVNAGIINNDDIHTHLKGQGFKGFTHSTHPEHTGIVGLYEKQPVEEMGKSELQKGLSPDQIKGEGYRFKILPPGKNVDAFRVRAYNKGKKIGHMIFNKNPFSVPDTESMADRSHKNGYHSVISSEIHPEHRGKGLYQHMINFGSQYVKSQGSKGLMSEGYQRSGDATRAWDKAASHAALEGHSVGRPKVRSATYFKSESFGKSLTDSLFENLMKSIDDGLCTMFMFEGCDLPDVLHCTHQYFGRGVSEEETDKIIKILKDHFKENPFKPIQKTFNQEEFFGEEKDIRVLRPSNNDGLLLRLKSKLDKLYPDKWPEYKAHVSVSSNVDVVDAPIVNYILCKGGKILWKAVKD